MDDFDAVITWIVSISLIGIAIFSIGVVCGFVWGRFL